MRKLHHAEVAHVNRDELFHPMALREPQKQSVDIGETQLAVTLEDCGRPLMVALLRWQQLDSAFLCPVQNNQGYLGRTRRCDAHAEQRVGLADPLPCGRELPSLAP